MKTYNELKQRTKIEILKEYQKLSDEYEELESRYNNLDEWASEQENAAYEFSKKLEEIKKTNPNITSIVNVNHFIWRLNIENLYSKDLEEFIQTYLKYYNI